MEIFELRYFLGVAHLENVHRASEKLNVSPGSLSKAIARLESELGVSLFKREGRNIKLTVHGRIFQKRASEMIHLEESVKTELLGHSGTIQVVLAGPEVLLSHFGLTLSSQIKKRFPLAKFDFHTCDDDRAIQQVKNGEAHLGFISSDSPNALHSKLLGQTTFQTYIGSNHPLHSLVKQKKVIPVEEILKYSFVSLDNPLLGAVGFKQSLDGWRDDKFPRKLDYLASSLKLLENLVAEGLAVAYLPDYFADPLGLTALKISGCPYSCSQKIKVIARNPKEISWLNQVVDF